MHRNISQACSTGKSSNNSRLYFINTPMLFDAVWNKISESIDANTLNKIVLLNDDLS